MSLNSPQKNMIGRSLPILEFFPRNCPRESGKRLQILGGHSAMLSSIPRASCCLPEGGKRQLRRREQTESLRRIEQLCERALPVQRIVLNKYAPVWAFNPFLPQIPAHNVLSPSPVTSREVMKVYEFIGFTPPIWKERLVLTWRIIKAVSGEVHRDGWIPTDTEGSCECRARRNSFHKKDYGQQGQAEGVFRELGSGEGFWIDSLISWEEARAEYRRQRGMMMSVDSLEGEASEESYDVGWRMR